MHATEKIQAVRQQSSFPLIITLHFILLQIVVGIHSCPPDLGGGVCPDDSKCCKIQSVTGHIASGCLPSNKHIQGSGTCCNDDALFGSGTACPGNFQCGFSMKNGANTTTCFLRDSEGGDIIEEMPRYSMVEAPAGAISDYYGFPISPIDEKAVLAYYSNMGPILTSKNSLDLNIEIVVIIVHGSGRNADGYLYSMMSAVEMQNCKDNVLVIAPRFLAVEDGVLAVPLITDQPEMIKMVPPMNWNETDPIPHTWRYGANALSPSDDFSSYDAMDAIIETLFSQADKGGRFRNLKRVVVSGHSAGGQFTHRWSLTSNSPIWGDNINDANAQTRSSRTLNHRQRSRVELLVVVANPRSFAYLDNRRFTNSSNYEIPPQELRNSCPTYNSWEWGLDAGGLYAPYKDKAVANFDGDISKLATRYSNRKVIYLAGGNDTQILRGSCEDDWFQGPTRLARSYYFMKSMQIIFDKPKHSRFVIRNVGHDHSLVFQSEEARTVMFGGICTASTGDKSSIETHSK